MSLIPIGKVRRRLRSLGNRQQPVRRLDDFRIMPIRNDAVAAHLAIEAACLLFNRHAALQRAGKSAFSRKMFSSGLMTSGTVPAPRDR